MKSSAICWVAYLVTVSLVNVSAAPTVTDVQRIRINETALELYLRECVRNFTIMISTGIPSMNIPAFDPWKAEGEFPYQVQDSNLILKLSGNAASVQSVGFSSVQVPTLDLDTVSSTYNISFFVPSLDMNGSYDCSGSYSLFLPIFGSGQFRITLYNVSGHGSATVNYGETSLSLSLIVSDALTFKSLAAQFQNLVGVSEDVRPRVSILMATQLYFGVQEQFRQQFTKSLTDYLNEELAKYPLKIPVAAL